mgnify:CR=1 FL=1
MGLGSRVRVRVRDKCGVRVGVRAEVRVRDKCGVRVKARVCVCVCVCVITVYCCQLLLMLARLGVERRTAWVRVGGQGQG